MRKKLIQNFEFFWNGFKVFLEAFGPKSSSEKMEIISTAERWLVSSTVEGLTNNIFRNFETWEVALEVLKWIKSNSRWKYHNKNFPQEHYNDQ